MTTESLVHVCGTCGSSLGPAQSRDEEILMVPATAALLKTPEATLRHWRVQGIGPRWFKLGRRVAYRRGDVDSWVAEQVAAAPTPAA